MDWFILLTIASIVFIVVYGLVRLILRRRGTWATKLTYTAPVLPPPSAEKRSDSKGELRTRSFLEQRFGVLFPKARPSFLANQVTGGKYNLELDCFNESLGLAVEFNGRQHYEFIPYFHRNKETFLNQKYRDELKAIYCKQNGIVLIRVPYNVEKRLESWLDQELIKNGF
jgi:hypothetical protein